MEIATRLLDSQTDIVAAVVLVGKGISTPAHLASEGQAFYQ